DERRPVDILEIDGTVSPEQADTLERAIWQHLPDLKPLQGDQFGYFHDQTSVRHSDPLALTQLLLVYHLLRTYSAADELPLASPVLSLSHLFPSKKTQHNQ
ncbi:MAG: phosphoribulokinase, partial [Blastochloris sp.]|nr:phosphoribulokinase [Blastochloris sp.]